MTDFFQQIFKYTPDPDHSYVSWGSVFAPIFLSVSQLWSGVGEVTTDRDLYFSPTPRQDGGMKKSDVFGSSVAWVEYDYYKLPVYTQALLPPSYIVSSGKGHHLYWLLNRFYKPQDVERANRVLAGHVLMTGEFCGNINRVLRVPGSFNFKYGDPLTAEILEVHPERVYTLSDLLHLQRYDPALLEIPNGASRSERDFRLSARLFEWGVSRDAVREALITYSTKAQERQATHEEQGYTGFVDYIERTLTAASTPAPVVPSDNKNNKDKVDDKPIANVEFESVGWLVGERGEERGLSLRLTWGEDSSVLAAAQADDFQSRTRVISWLKRFTGTRTFFGSDAKALALWGHLVDTTPDQYQLQVPHAGRYDLKDGKRTFVYDQTSALTYPETGEGNVFWQPAIEVEGHHVNLGDPEDLISVPEMTTILNLILQSQRPEVIIPALGWVAASPFKPILEAVGGRMPTLLLYGVRGSGKTSVIQQVLLPFLGVDSRPIAADISFFALVGHLALTNAWPVWVGEYRASNRNNAEFQQALRSAYDGGTVERGRPNQSVVSHVLTAAVIMDGETPFQDAANNDRTISLRLLSDTIVPGTGASEAFMKLRTWQWYRGPMARHFLNWTLTKGRDYIANLYGDGLTIMTEALTTSRAANNFAVAWMGLRILQDFINTYGMEVQLPNGIEELLTAARNTHTPGLGTQTYVDMLVSQVSHYWSMPGLDAEFDVEGDVLWFNLTRAIHALRLSIDTTMLTLQLQERIGVYIIGPSKRPNGGGALYWGIELDKAQALGLDVFRPFEKRHFTQPPGNGHARFERTEDEKITTS